ncbi:MAG: ABC transporter permease [Methanobacteriota archaeon]|nr:MAG: ABC transporter permease [Euryarchaeota archaeon]
MSSLLRYIARRTVQGVVTLLIVTVVIFLLFTASGSPIAQFRADPTFDRAKLAQLENSFGLNQPWYVQMGKFLWNMFSFNFGWSSFQGKPVSDVIGEALPRTLFLFGGAVIVEYAIGVVIGQYIAWKRGRVTEGGVVMSSLFFYNMPSFWIGLILLWLFAFTINKFPLGGFADVDAMNAGGLTLAGNIIWHAALPMLALILINAAGTILLMRTSMLEVMGEDYILTAKAKGLPERIVRRRHAARNAYLPVVTSLTISLSFSVGGAIILEQVFSYFGIGYYFLQSVLRHDNFLAGAVLFIISLLVIFGNIIADILYGVLDPRVRI